MLRRDIETLPAHIYPPEEWRLVEKQFYPRLLAQTETLFALANGFLGIRGACEEGGPAFHHGTFVNGFHETWPIVYGEDAFGFARTGQTIVNVPDGKIIRLYVDDEPLDLSRVRLQSYERALDMRTGTLDREIVWEKYSGKVIRVRSRRIVSFVHRHMAAILYEVMLLKGDAPIVISSQLDHIPGKQPEVADPRGTRAIAGRILLPEFHRDTEMRVMLGHVTRMSRQRLASGIDHEIETDCPLTIEHRSGEESGRVIFSVEATEGKPIRLVKFMTYHNSRSAGCAELVERADRALDRARRGGIDKLLAQQEGYLAEFWDRADVVVRGDPAIQQIIRFNLFHIGQASARAERVGIPAKGLTGDGYEGHYFWDAEIYVLPFLVYTEPRLARNLLLFRYTMLEKARTRAREVNQKGALFPWRTISGEEASAYYAAGTAQYHINADIMYALKKYVEISGDTDFLESEGAEMLVETARLWADLGFFSPSKGGKFCINGVTGPDEYHAVVNNNLYTNLMARENLRYAAQTVAWLRENRPSRYTALVYNTRLDEGEIAAWQRAADQMHLPYDEAKGIHLQDDDSLNLQPWDFENTPPEKYPLLLHFHPLVIYRHQVIKQADVVLAMFLLGNHFSHEQKRRNFEFYDPLTTGDSSLSVSIQSIIAGELGLTEKARNYARYAVLMDLADIAANVEHGCHIASMGGTWMALINGFGGMRDYDGQISFNPALDPRLKTIQFSLLIRGRRLRVEIDQETQIATYLLANGPDLEITHCGNRVTLSEGKPARLPIRRRTIETANRYHAVAG
jgi:alpha,alpha-trehalose phosphorylase